MICAEFSASGPVVASAVQPADVSTCALILVSGSDLDAIRSIAPPTPADFAGAFGLGFGLVVMSYLIAWPVGTLLRFLGWLR